MTPETGIGTQCNQTATQLSPKPIGTLLEEQSLRIDELTQRLKGFRERMSICIDGLIGGSDKEITKPEPPDCMPGTLARLAYRTDALLEEIILLDQEWGRLGNAI